MTLTRIAEVTRRARIDAQAQKAGWPVRACPFQSQDEADLYQEIFEQALREVRR